MKKVLFILVFLLGDFAGAYYGAQSTEALLTFEATADVPWVKSATGVLSRAPRFRRTHKNLFLAEERSFLTEKLPTLAELNAEGPIHKKAIDLVETQIEHLMGTFQSASFLKTFKYAGALGEQQNYTGENYNQLNYEIKFTGIKEGLAPGRALITYRFQGKTIFNIDAFKSKKEVSIPLRLPLSPDLIYKQSLSKKDGKPFNFCTDPGYNDEGDFWYFWDPEQKDCPLNGDDKLVLNFSGSLKELPNSTDTYPDYNKLFKKKSVRVSLLLGYVDDIDDDQVNVPHKKDETYGNFLAICKDLEAQGYRALKDSAHFKNAFRMTASGRQEKGANFLREYVSTVHTADRRDVEVHVQVLLSDTQIDSKDETFHYYFVPALEESDVLIYDGHSGLGGNLDLASFPTVKFDQTKYQIFFFNGCSSYTYYNGMFFNAKNGSKYLDIVNSGLETSSDSTARNAFTFLRYILNGKFNSYETILTDLEKSNHKVNGTYLTGVSGEKDNTFKPK